MEYYYRSSRNHYACKWFNAHFSEFWVNENALVSSETNLFSWSCNLSSLVLEKVLQIKNLEGNILPIENIKLRQANEIATFILFLVVFTVILKSMVIEYWWQLILGFVVLVGLIMATVKLVNKKKS